MHSPVKRGVNSIIKYCLCRLGHGCELLSPPGDDKHMGPHHRGHGTVSLTSGSKQEETEQKIPKATHRTQAGTCP